MLQRFALVSVVSTLVLGSASGALAAPPRAPKSAKTTRSAKPAPAEADLAPWTGTFGAARKNDGAPSRSPSQDPPAAPSAPPPVAPAPEVAPPGVSAPPPAADATSPKTVTVHFESDYAGTRVESGGGQLLCVAPCSATLTPGDSYRVDAPGMVSTSFVAKAEQRSLRVDGGSATARVGGVVLVALGGGAVAFAGGLASVVSQGLTDHSMSTDTAKPLLTASIVSLTVGAAFLVSGWILALANGTSVTPGAAKARPAARNVWITPTGLSF